MESSLQKHFVGNEKRKLLTSKPDRNLCSNFLDRPDMITVLGVRHHGPGSARGVITALGELRPDCILVEGPPDAQRLLGFLTRPRMRPPVALLIYAPSDLGSSVFYPFAEFSPEWQALKFAHERGIEVRFMDLPQTHQLPMRAQASPSQDQPLVQLPEDVFETLARAAGYERFEKWWEHVIEHRGAGLPVFEAVHDAMMELRRARPDGSAQNGQDRRIEQAREAYMRQTIRAAGRDGFDRIAVVCGAWHGPALTGTFSAKADTQILKGLPSVKVEATWSPWTFGRLTFASGYGAGVESPGWYQHQWERGGQTTRQMIIGWLARVAALLRAEDLDVSSAHLIEAARLAEALAALRGRGIPDLAEVNEAALSVICGGDDAPLRLIQNKLIVGETMGEIPDDAPLVPLQRDLQTEQKRLRLSPSAETQRLELDTRVPGDLDRSRLFHRLNALGVRWAVSGKAATRGTFKEIWQLRWDPEFSVALIEASVWGNTVAAAASTRLSALADGLRRETFVAGGAAHNPPALAELAALLNTALLAELPDALSHILQRLKDRAATSGDVTRLMDALPSLVNALRYGNARQTDAGMIGEAVDGFVARICIGLSMACLSLNDEAAREMMTRLGDTHSAIGLLRIETHLAAWQTALRQVMEHPGASGLLAGRATRLLRDAGAMTPDESARRLGFALSGGNDPVYCAAWIEGFLSGGGAMLLHDDALRGLIDGWLTGIQPEAFQRVLPLLRRTFAQFSVHERRNLGELTRRGAALPGLSQDTGLDVARAEAALPLALLMLGLDTSGIQRHE